jgi:hypothetical protein
MCKLAFSETAFPESDEKKAPAKQTKKTANKAPAKATAPANASTAESDSDDDVAPRNSIRALAGMHEMDSPPPMTTHMAIHSGLFI